MQDKGKKGVGGVERGEDIGQRENRILQQYSGAQENWEEDVGKGKSWTLDTAGNEREAE